MAVRELVGTCDWVPVEDGVGRCERDGVADREPVPVAVGVDVADADLEGVRDFVGVKLDEKETAVGEEKAGERMGGRGGTAVRDPLTG